MTPASLRRSVCACILAALLAPLGGCQVLGFGGAMMESYKRSSTKTVKAEYTGLEGKRWAVVVSADRVIQADYPNLVPALTAQITGRLADKPQQEMIGATGYIPPASILRFQYENPGWLAMSRGELAGKLGVDRLVMVELIEYRLNEPGNQYLWEGQATGTMAVFEADGGKGGGGRAETPAFEKPIRVSYPDTMGMGPQDLPAQAIAQTLVNRFVDRCTWVFYAHQEPYYPKY
ncbi:MAG: hypothetical protein WD749_09685 [Phycisphaerales bacterium]